MACEQLHIDWHNKFHEWEGPSNTSSFAEYRSNSSPTIMSTTWYLYYIANYVGVQKSGRDRRTITVQLCREDYGKKLEIKGVLYYTFDSQSNISSYILDYIMDSDAKHVTIFEMDRSDLPKRPTKLTCVAWLTELRETEEKSMPTLRTSSKLLGDMWEMYKKQDYTDLIVVCKDVEIRVHKCVLSARSEVFAKMFEHDTTESSSNQIIISDIEPEIFRELLKFLYCGEIDTSIYSKAHDLYYAAEKYFVSDLKDICRHIITSSLSIKTAVETLRLADRHNDEEMMQKAVTFIVSSFQDIKSTEAWVILQKEYPLATLTIALVAENSHSKNGESM